MGDGAVSEAPATRQIFSVSQPEHRRGRGFWFNRLHDEASKFFEVAERHLQNFECSQLRLAGHICDLGSHLEMCKSLRGSSIGSGLDHFGADEGCRLLWKVVPLRVIGLCCCCADLRMRAPCGHLGVGSCIVHHLWNGLACGC